MIWERIGTNINSEGTTLTYAVKGAGKRVLIQSRRRHIPHAPSKVGGGTWDHTTYFVLRDGEEVRELNRLMDAKAFAERLITEAQV